MSFVFGWGFPIPIIESHQNFGVTCNISLTAEASDFKFGTQLGFANSHHKIHPEEKVSAGLG